MQVQIHQIVIKSEVITMILRKEQRRSHLEIKEKENALVEITEFKNILGDI